MARRPRDTAEGLFHVTTHAVREVPLYHRALDRMHFLRELARALARTDVLCVGYCLMTTHYHLLLNVGDGALPRVMHSLNFRYAAWLNATYAFRGHVTAARYWSRRISDDADLRGAYRYVMRNPVRAGITATAAEWEWSSFAGTLGIADARDFVDASSVIDAFDGTWEERTAELRRYVEGA